VTEPDIATLADAVGWAAATARLLADLGFSLVNSDHPGAPGGANLLVALRDRPTLRHFDPELIRVWVTSGGRGRQLEVDRRRARPFERAVTWGHVHVIDRLDVENRFLTFGGRLRAADVDEGTMVVALQSPGPIVRWGGHSQGDDPLAGEVGAFFGRLMIPVDFEPGAEGRLGSTEPSVLYAAFVRHHHDRLGRAPDLRETAPAFEVWIAAEAGRLAAEDSAAWAAAEPLMVELGLASPGLR
jgi:hypothetical protein